MKLQISKEAASWYKQELDLKDGDFVRFFVKLYGGIPTVHPNYSLGVLKEEPKNISIQTTCDGVTFYFDEHDAWYLNEFNLNILMDDQDIRFDYSAI